MQRRMDERDEFLLSQLLDGDLPAAEAAELRERIARDPALRAAFETLARVDAALTRRRADQPAVNWNHLHRQIVERVEAERARPAILKFPRWFWIGAPIAAAAAITLAVISMNHSNIQGPTNGKIEIVKKSEPAPQLGTLAVRFNRPSYGKSAPVRVSYTQSPDLAKAMRERDVGYRSRPSWHMYIAEAKQPASSALNLPPL